MLRYQKKAAALKYLLDKDAAPKVVAKGKGYIAEKIIEAAQANNVHLHEDPDLVEVLEGLELDTEIPPDMFRAVAEVLAFVYKLNQGLE